MITREQFENSYIINDHGELRDKYIKFAARNGKGFSTNFSRYSPIILVGSNSKIQHWTGLKKFFSSNWIDRNQPKQLTLADFEEDKKEEEEIETPVIEDRKVIKKYIREEYNTRGQALDNYDSGVVFYTPINDGYSVVDETGILDHFGQLFTLEEREETWQDVAQEFIKSNPIFDEDEFLLEMFSDDYSEYHEPMKQLAKLIVGSSK